MDDVGIENTLRLGKQSKIRIGARYRFYFKQEKPLASGSHYLDRTHLSGLLLGFEEL